MPSKEGNQGWRCAGGHLPNAERLRSLRPLYKARDWRLRALVGFEGKADPPTPGHRAVTEAADTMLKAVGIPLEEVTRGENRAKRALNRARQPFLHPITWQVDPHSASANKLSFHLPSA